MKTAWIRRLVGALLALALILPARSENVEEKWIRRYRPPGGNSGATALAVDGSGNVVVVGGLSDANGSSNYTAKYAAADGALLWEKRYVGVEGVGSGNEIRAVAVDGAGNVVVTGGFTVKYAAANGALLWAQRYDNGNSAVGNAVAVDSSGNVVVTGTCNSSSGVYGDWEIFTAKYAAANGALLWEKRYNGQEMASEQSIEAYDSAYAVAVDGSGNVVVTGTAVAGSGLTDYYTAKYAAANGALLWEKRYNVWAGSGGGRRAAANRPGRNRQAE